jgi:hypothetical protein
MQRRSFIAALLTLPVLGRQVLSQAAGSVLSQAAFKPGEKLTYTLGWQFITAGRAVLEVLPDQALEDRMVRNFKMTARTRSSVDKIFKVRDSLTSVTEYDISRALEYKKIQREGDHKRNETVHFDWDKMEARYHEALRDKRVTTPIQPNTLDPLSAFYFIRNQKFDVGSVIEGPMTDGKKCKVAKIEVVKREKIKVNGKKYDTFKLVPDIKDVGGVFKKSKKATIEIWCTADDRHIPVLLKSKVIIGSFNAKLDKTENV